MSERSQAREAFHRSRPASRVQVNIVDAGHRGPVAC